MPDPLLRTELSAEFAKNGSLIGRMTVQLCPTKNFKEGFDPRKWNVTVYWRKTIAYRSFCLSTVSQFLKSRLRGLRWSKVQRQQSMLSIILPTRRLKLPCLEAFSVAGKMSMRFDGKTPMVGRDICQRQIAIGRLTMRADPKTARESTVKHGLFILYPEGCAFGRLMLRLRRIAFYQKNSARLAGLRNRTSTACRQKCHTNGIFIIFMFASPGDDE